MAIGSNQGMQVSLCFFGLRGAENTPSHLAYLHLQKCLWFVANYKDLY